MIPRIDTAPHGVETSPTSTNRRLAGDPSHRAGRVAPWVNVGISPQPGTQLIILGSDRVPYIYIYIPTTRKHEQRLIRSIPPDTHGVEILPPLAGYRLVCAHRFSARRGSPLRTISRSFRTCKTFSPFPYFNPSNLQLQNPRTNTVIPRGDTAPHVVDTSEQPQDNDVKPYVINIERSNTHGMLYIYCLPRF